jgi:hypothetical protein
MAAEEDKRFDRVLGGFLVNDLRIRAGALHCPESDTLSAYHERSLLPEEMNSWKEHIVGCARCQAILAELEATDSISLQVSEKEEVLIEAAAMPAAFAGQTGKATIAKVPEKERVTPISRVLRWQWLAPAGALAAGLLVWVAWHEHRLPQGKAPAEVTTAKLEPPATLSPPVTPDGRQSVSADEADRISKDQSAAVGGPVPAKPASEAKTLKQFEKSDSRAKVALARPTAGESSKGLESSIRPADKEAGARADTALDSLSAANRAQNRPAQDTKAGLAGAVSQTVEVQTPAANARPQNQQNLQAQQNQLNEQKTSGPNPSRHLEQKKKNKDESSANLLRAAAPPPAPTTPPAAFSENVRASSTLMAGGLVQHLINTPGGKSFWRVGHIGMIEFSSDGGASWSRQTSNVSADLTAGSAPSDRVCWIVGRDGTILLTTDAGSHWATIHSPLDEDLGGVRATDALHASIWNLANTKALETSDGGDTWKPAKSQ